MVKYELKKRIGNTTRIILYTWSGKIGVSLLIIFIMLAAVVMIYYYPTVTTSYGRGVASDWIYNYPLNAPPCWSVHNKFKGFIISKDSLNTTGIKKGVITIPGIFGPKKIMGYKLTYTGRFIYTSNAFPSDILLVTSIRTGVNLSYVKLLYYLERPDGSKITLFNSTIETNKLILLYGSTGSQIKGKINLQPLSINSINKNSPIYPYLMSSLQKIYDNKVSLSSYKISDLMLGTLVKDTTGNIKLKPMKGNYTIYLSLEFLLEPGAKINIEKNKIGLEAFQWKFMSNCYGLFGTDNVGRPIGLGLLLGIPYAFYIGFTVTFISTFIGAIYGTLAGYWKDIKGEALMRVADIVNSLPFLPILIVLSYVFRQTINLNMLAFLMIILFWAGPVIIVRSAALQISEQLYIEAAKASGASTSRIILRHIFPQILPYTLAIAVLSIPGIIVTEAGLSLLGFGDPTAPTWGKMLQNAYDSQAVINGWWWTYLFPGLALVVFSATFLLIGRAIEPLVAPKLQK
ncbi:MAG: ABC transporter permease [Desulfurococcales archaeon]|nr:ABC transporter permease [Desulfurococcales archaeon]